MQFPSQDTSNLNYIKVYLPNIPVSLSSLLILSLTLGLFLPNEKLLEKLHLLPCSTGKGRVCFRLEKAFSVLVEECDVANRGIAVGEKRIRQSSPNRSPTACNDKPATVHPLRAIVVQKTVIVVQFFSDSTSLHNKFSTMQSIRLCNGCAICSNQKRKPLISNDLRPISSDSRQSP